MRILVTGGAGFIGSHLVAALLEKGHMVVVADDLSGGFERNIPTGAIFHKCDLSKSAEVEYLFSSFAFDVVYHLAAYAAEGLSYFIPEYNYNNNLLASTHIITQCVLHKVKRVIFTSSMAVYGHQPVPYEETMTPSPVDPYGVAKYAVELHLKAMREMHGLEYVIFRPQNVYGRNQHIGDSYRNVIGIFMNQILQGKPMTVFGDGEQQRAFSHISTIIPYFVDAMTDETCVGEVFNIGGSNVYTINELTDAIRMQCGDAEVVHLEPRIEVKQAYASPRKAQIFFKNVEYCDVDLHSGIADMRERAKELGPQEPTVFGAIEIKENLPSKWVALFA